MQRHPYFDLTLHEDFELESLLESKMVERLTLHEWPLSCVQKLILEDGRQLVYKSASQPSVEAVFYTRARSKLLLPVKVVYQENGYECLLLEWVEAPRLEDMGWQMEAVVRAGHVLLAETVKIQGNVPCYLDLRSSDGWAEVVDQIITPLSRLHRASKLQEVDTEMITAIRAWTKDRGVLAALDGDLGLVHNDMSGDNVFILPDGYRLIDWQRPIYGPPDLDLITLLESLDMPSASMFAPGLLRLRRLLSIHWLAQCADRWFPPGVETYDRQISSLANDLEKGC